MTGGGGQCDKKKKTLGRVVMFSFLNNQLKRSIFYSLGCWDFIFLSRDSFFREEAKCGKKQEKCRGNTQGCKKLIASIDYLKNEKHNYSS